MWFVSLYARYTRTKCVFFCIFFRSSNWTSRMVALMSDDYITREPFTVKAVIMPHIVLTLHFTHYFMYIIIFHAYCFLYHQSCTLRIELLASIAWVQATASAKQETPWSRVFLHETGTKSNRNENWNFQFIPLAKAIFFFGWLLLSCVVPMFKVTAETDLKCICVYIHYGLKSVGSVQQAEWLETGLSYFRPGLVYKHLL
jgi:hypothetical protein